MNWLEQMVANGLKHLSTTARTRHAADSLQLEEFRTFDFSSISREMAVVFKNTHDRIAHRYAGFVYRCSVDGAPQYVQSPTREWDTRDDGIIRQVEGYYRRLKIDRLLLDCENALVAQQAYLVTALRNKRGEIVLTRWLPWQVVGIEFDDPLDRSDITKAYRITLAMPVQSAALSMMDAHLELTRETAVIRYPDGQVVPYGVIAEHGLGRVPCVATRKFAPARGGWLPPVAGDILTAQIGIILAMSDTEYIIRSQSSSKVMISGDGVQSLPQEVADRPDGILPMPVDTIPHVLALDPPIEKYMKVVDFAIGMVSDFRYLRPKPYQASIVTGAGRAADAAGYYEERIRQAERTREIEDQLITLLAQVDQASVRAEPLPLGLSLKGIKYHYVTAEQNVLQQAQALSLMISEGLASRIDTIAERERVTVAEAQKILQRRLAEEKSYLEAMGRNQQENQPGLDRLAIRAPDIDIEAEVTNV